MNDAVFKPFRGTRFRDGIDSRTAPPYDVLDSAAAAALRAKDGHNIVHVDLPVDVGDAGATAAGGLTGTAEADDSVRAAHRRASELLTAWVADTTLVVDEEALFYLYRQGYRGADGRPGQTTGVVGALRIDAAGVLPHEETTKKASSDRLVSLEETHTNISMIYAMSMAKGLGSLLEPEGPPVLAVTDEDGVHHRLWEIRSPARLTALSEVMETAPIVIADGHHRYTVAARLLADGGDAPPVGADRILTFVVPLDPAFLVVRPIHRVVGDLGVAPEVVRERLEEIADVADVAHADPVGTNHDAVPDAITFLLPDRALRVTPRLRPEDDETLGAEPECLRSLAVVWLHKVAFVHLGIDHVVFHHSPAVVAERVGSGEAAAGVLLPPVTVDEIAAVAAAGQRMPPKTTFFWPKARTGIVMRRFVDQV